MITPIGIDSTTGKKKFIEPGDDVLTGKKVISLGKTQGDNIASTGETYLSSSGRTFFSHAGNGGSEDACAFPFKLYDFQSGGRVWITFTTASDGNKYVVYKAQITIWDGDVKTQEELTFTEVLTTSESTYPQLKTEVLEFSQSVRDAINNNAMFCIKVVRDAGHANDDYNGTAYTEFCNFEYNY